MAAASLVEVELATVAALNAATAGTWTATLADARRSTGEIRHAIVEADAGVVLAILFTPGHPLRSGYMAASASLNHGDEIPDSVGTYGQVEVDIAGTSAWVTGTPADLDDIKLMRRNPNSMFGSLAHNTAGSPIGGYYTIRDQRVFFTGTNARVWVGAFTPNYASPACAAPEQYTQAIRAGAVARLKKEGDMSDVFDRAATEFAAHIATIRQGATELPVIEQVQRAA